jgi:hypothetical protein
MTQLKGQGVVFKKDSRQMGDFINYTYELTISGKPNKQGIVATTNIRLSANKDMGGEIGSVVDFTAELVPYTKKDGSGSSYLFRALSMNFKSAPNKVDMSDIDDEIPAF